MDAVERNLAAGNRLVRPRERNESDAQICSDIAVVRGLDCTPTLHSTASTANRYTDCFHDSRWIGLQGIKTKKGVRNSMSAQEEVRSMWRWVFSSAFLASMCCFPSVLLVGLGLMTVSAGDALSNDLYFGPARWALYGLTILLLSIGLYRHFRSHGICTLNQAKRERRKIANTAILVFTTTFAIYLFWNYVILELLGIAVGLPWEESAFWR